MKFFLLFLSTIPAIICQSDIKTFIQNINHVTTNINSLSAEINWESATNPSNPNLPDSAANFQRKNIVWREKTCAKLAALESGLLLNSTERRMAYLTCRGPRFTVDEARKSNVLYDHLQSIYNNVEVCIPYDKTVAKGDLGAFEDAILKYISTVKSVLNLKTSETVSRAAKLATDAKKMQSSVCLKGEEFFEEMMMFSRNEKVLKWVWLVWREKTGPLMEGPYRNYINLQTKAARRNGYKDLGASWRDELEIPNLRALCRQLFIQIKPLYSLLHGVTRFFLRKKYGEVVPPRGAIPAHLFGSLSAERWDSIADLIIPQVIDLDKTPMKNLNGTVAEPLSMVKHAEDFYQSLGLPAMTDTFWRESVFTQDNPATRCQPAAVDMFKDGDVRMIYCSTTTAASDLYGVHHEIGHIQYFMAYEKQSGIFRDANSALQESIGDAIYYGVMTPQHLHRLGLINDSILYNSNPVQESTKTNEEKEILMLKKEDSLRDVNANDVIDEENTETIKEKDTLFNREESCEFNEVTADDTLLLKQALFKIPQLVFALLLDEYRWKYFEGEMNENPNADYWNLALELQGISPPEVRNGNDFDAAAKYHVPSNIPSVRYFLSGFLQHQLFESLCRVATVGHITSELPNTLALHRCDIYGSRPAGKLLKDLMSRGHSQHWREILQATIGSNDISATALKRYYQPVYKLLRRLVCQHRIPIGW